MTGITKRYPGVLALDRVDLDLSAGEVHALTGENGSGKSTLAKILYGATGADHGTIEIDGEQVTIGSASRALELGIVAISQELTLAPSLSVAENILMGRLPVTRVGTIAWREAVALAGEALDRLGVRVDPRKRVADLPIELRQEVEIARAMSVKSRVLILDEATSSLSQGGVESLMRLVRQLADAGVAVLMITHRMPEIYESASRATVLRDGRRVAELPIPAASENELIRAMVGRELGDLFRKRKLDVGEPVLEVNELATLHGSVGPASFAVRSGEIVGVAGLVGSGKAELGLALAGALRSRGEVRVCGKPVTLKSPHTACQAGIAYVSDDRKRAGLFPTMSVRHNLTMPWLRMLRKLGVLIDVRHEAVMSKKLLERFRVVTSSPNSRITALSGGNQQKALLGRSFGLAPRVLVLAEPTRGVDVGAKREIYGLIQEIAEAGSCVVMISSELPELLGIADTIHVMYRGEIMASFDADEADEEQITTIAVGGRLESR